jgi:hypothetical protein
MYEALEARLIDLTRGHMCNSAIRKALLLVFFGGSFLASGCWRDVSTIWSVETRSPDGQWTASGRSEQHSGPGNAAVQTGVYLKRTTGSDPEETILLFFNEAPGVKGAISLKIDWLSPLRLQVTLSGHPDLDVQVVKYAGIEISVIELPNSN